MLWAEIFNFQVILIDITKHSTLTCLNFKIGQIITIFDIFNLKISLQYVIMLNYEFIAFLSKFKCWKSLICLDRLYKNTGERQTLYMRTIFLKLRVSFQISPNCAIKFFMKSFERFKKLKFLFFLRLLTVESILQMRINFTLENGTFCLDWYDPRLLLSTQWDLTRQQTTKKNRLGTNSSSTTI